MSQQKESTSLTEVYDECEIASAYEMEFTQRAIERLQNQMKPETSIDFDGKHCIECESEIPKGRLAMKKIRCVDCQTVLEKRSRTRG